MTSSPDRPGFGIRPRQKRSRETTQKIVSATLALLSEKAFERVTVSEIAARAGVSVGGFYARFPSKEAVLGWVNEELFQKVTADADRILDPERWRGKPIPPIIQAYITLAVRVFREHRSVLKQVSLRSRTSLDEGFRERVAGVNRHLHDAFRALLHERRDQIVHPRPEMAIDLGLTFVSAVMRETILFDEERAHFPSVEDDDVIREMTEAYCAYLRLAPPWFDSSSTEGVPTDV